MDTNKILEDVKNHLCKRVTDVAIEMFPDDPEKYRLNHPSGAVLISYQGSQYADAQDITFMNQPRTIELALTLITRSQWSDKGAIALLDQVRNALAGFTAKNCKKTVLKSEGFISSEAGLWTYQMIVMLPTFNIQHDLSNKI